MTLCDLWCSKSPQKIHLKNSAAMSLSCNLDQVIYRPFMLELFSFYITTTTNWIAPQREARIYSSIHWWTQGVEVAVHGGQCGQKRVLLDKPIVDKVPSIHMSPLSAHCCHTKFSWDMYFLPCLWNISSLPLLGWEAYALDSKGCRN